MLFGLLTTRENLLPPQQLRDQATSNLRDVGSNFPSAHVLGSATVAIPAENTSGARLAPRFGALELDRIAEWGEALIAFVHFARGAQREAFAAAPGRTAKAAMSTPP
jgi:hypothetical protein